MKKFKQDSLFDVDNLPKNPEFFSKGEKRKWYNAFEKYCLEKHKNEGETNGNFCCGYMNICDLCEMKKTGFSQCVSIIKETLTKNNIKINYKDFDFEKWVNMAEKILEK